MSRKLFGLSGLALLLAAALGMSTTSSAKSGLTVVGDDVAVGISGGQYCPYWTFAGYTGCGMPAKPQPMATWCPYCPRFYQSPTGTYGTPVLYTCYECGYPCGYCQAITPCVVSTGS